MMNNLKGGGMMKQLLQMQKQLKKAQKELERETVVGTAGDGSIKITLTGNQKCKKVELQEGYVKLLTKGEMEKQIGSAISDALEKSKKLMADKLGPLSGGIPGLNL